jgi:hypothetical protein
VNFDVQTELLSMRQEARENHEDLRQTLEGLTEKISAIEPRITLLESFRRGVLWCVTTIIVLLLGIAANYKRGQ